MSPDKGWEVIKSGLDFGMESGILRVARVQYCFNVAKALSLRHVVLVVE